MAGKLSLTGGGPSIERFKNSFFDRAAITGAVSRAELVVLSRMGAFVRTRARSSLRYRKAPSAVGQPPSVHQSIQRLKTKRDGTSKTQSVSPLREFLYFALDQRSRMTVVGPAAFGPRPGVAPRLQEKGGSDSAPPRKKGFRIEQRTLNYPPRPFMAPALAAERPKFAMLWHNKVSR